MILYRSVGLPELQLIFENGLKAFPPRLPEQPFFYPVLNLEYARQIASDWNTTSEPFAGYVTKFEIGDDYANQFERRIVGGIQHEELWIPSERLAEFNRQIINPIRIVEAYFGKDFRGYIPKEFGLKGKDAVSQFVMIANSYTLGAMDVHIEFKVNKTAIFLNYPFWLSHDFTKDGIDEARYRETLEKIKKSWSISFPEIPLGFV